MGTINYTIIAESKTANAIEVHKSSVKYITAEQANKITADVTKQMTTPIIKKFGYNVIATSIYASEYTRINKFTWYNGRTPVAEVVFTICTHPN
jgi:hypothetical protein